VAAADTHRRSDDMRLSLSKFETLEDKRDYESREHADDVRRKRVELARHNERWTEIPRERLISRGPHQFKWLVDAATDVIWVGRLARSLSLVRSIWSRPMST
jgi:hypothetical protein